MFAVKISYDLGNYLPALDGPDFLIKKSVYANPLTEFSQNRFLNQLKLYSARKIKEQAKKDHGRSNPVEV